MRSLTPIERWSLDLARELLEKQGKAVVENENRREFADLMADGVPVEVKASSAPTPAWTFLGKNHQKLVESGGIYVLLSKTYPPVMLAAKDFPRKPAGSSCYRLFDLWDKPPFLEP